MTENIEEQNLKKLQAVKNTYILYVLGGVCAFVPFGFISVFGVFCLLAGGIMAYYFKSLTNETDLVYREQSRWLIRTFWLANLVAFPLAAIVNVLLVMQFTEFDEIIMSGISGGYGTDMSSAYNDVVNFQQNQMGTLFLITLVSYGPLLLWWLHRCQKGWRALKQGTPELF